MAIIIPSPIVKPFCNSGFETPPLINSDTIVANQEIGFPPLQETPLNAGGEPCTIDQMNGVFNFYTSQIQALVSGWKFTFDQDVSDQNGGYPAGVILYSPTTNSFQRSLVNNNTANFNTTPSYIDDQINWSSDILINSINITSAIDFYNSAKTFYTSLAASNSAIANTNYKLPPSYPAFLGQNLTSDLSGNWNWAYTNAQYVQGNNAGTAPNAGFIGELIELYIFLASGGQSGLWYNTLPINLTPGIWDISALAYAALGPSGNTQISEMSICISTYTSNTSTPPTDYEPGKNGASIQLQSPSTFPSLTLSVPFLRVNISINTTYHLNTFSVFTNSFGPVGMEYNAKISAVRVG